MTITLTREEAQQVLDALEEAQDYTSCPAHSPSMTRQCAVAAVALRAQLAQPEPEPVAWASENVIPLRGLADNHACLLTPFKCAANTVPLYTAPPQREWQGLTSSERKVLWLAANNPTEFGEMLEAKLKEKNA